MKISIIIACYNAENYIQQCLDSIYHSSFKNFEIIAINNSSQDSTLEILKKNQLSKHFLLKSLKNNMGSATARNLGAQNAKGEILFFIDNDTEIDKNCLKEIDIFFNKSENIGAIQCRLTRPNGEIDSLGHHLSIFGFPYEITELSSKEKQKKILGAKTAGLAVRKSVFNKINGFDEDYLISAEDTDLSWRIWLSGSILIYLPTAIVIHHEKRSTSNKNRIYYQGSKNLINSITKNSDLVRLSYILPLNIFVWILISLKLLLAGNPKSSLLIYKGIWWNFRNLSRTISKRAEIYSKNNVFYIPDNLLFGNISTFNLVQKGWRWFTSE